MSDNLSDNHPSRQTLYWTECSSFRRIINIFKTTNVRKCQKIGFCKRLSWRNFSSLTSNRIRKSIKELFYHHFEQKTEILGKMLRAVFYCQDEKESFVIIFDRCDRCVSFCDHLESLYFRRFTLIYFKLELTASSILVTSMFETQYVGDRLFAFLHWHPRTVIIMKSPT